MPELLEKLPFPKDILVELMSLNDNDIERFINGQSKNKENIIYIDFIRKFNNT